MVQAEISPSQLAEQLGKPTSMISRWRHHGCDSASTLEKIAKACGLTYSEMMGLSD